VSSGFSAEGIDLGSNNIRALRKPEVALAFGQGVTASEAGQVWFLLNQQLDMPVAKIDLASFQRALLNRYTTLVLPGGNYSAWDKPVVDKIKAWVSDGGTLITFQTATAWAVQQGIVSERLSATEVAPARGGRADNVPAPVEPSTLPAARPVQATPPVGGATQRTAPQNTTQRDSAGGRNSSSDRLDYAQQEDVEGSKRINGAIFKADIDITHPIAYGLTSRTLYINKNGPTLLLPSTNKYATVAQYNSKPFINGYSSRLNISRVANSAAIIATASGRGEVVLFADDPTYRGYWLGTARIFLNAIFFGNLLGGGFGQ
jgi:hypothetical protein